MSKEVEWGVIHGEGAICCECDQCSDTYDYDFDDGYPDYRSCQDELKRLGWMSRKIGDEWYDFCCKECYQQYLIDNNKGWR